MKIEEKNIDELLIAYLLEELDSDQIVSVEQWINASPDNKHVYLQIKKIWKESEHSNLKFDNVKAWKTVSTQINTNTNTNTNTKVKTKRFILRPWVGIAASLLVLISAYLIYDNNTSANNTTLATTLLVSHLDQKKEILSDGSNIQLNTNTQISYTTNFNKQKREVALKGEAFFEIKRDVTKPFIIHTENSKVEVLGTSFNIDAHPKDSVITVFVKSGLVRFSYLPQDTTKQYQEIQLSAGKKVIYNKYSKKIQLFNDKTYNQISTYWVNKKLAFEGIRLEKVTKILEIIYDVKIVLFNKGLENCHISVGFENDDINQIMDVIASTFNIKVEHANNTYILKGKSCEDK